MRRARTDAGRTCRVRRRGSRIAPRLEPCARRADHCPWRVPTRGTSFSADVTDASAPRLAVRLGGPCQPERRSRLSCRGVALGAVAVSAQHVHHFGAVPTRPTAAPLMNVPDAGWLSLECQPGCHRSEASSPNLSSASRTVRLTRTAFQRGSSVARGRHGVLRRLGVM
jgi:hypothetical protein